MDHSYEHNCKNGETVTIQYNDECEKFIAFNEKNQNIGSIYLATRQELSYRNEPKEYLYITNAHLDELGHQYKRQGIGQRCLEIAIETTSLCIYAAIHDGNQRDDGSHLTGDAPSFINRMEEKGIISGRL